jgi:hypothetical protein
MKTNEKISDTLTRKQESAIAALLSHPTTKDAAAAAGVSVPTLWRWLQDEDFDRAYKQARRESVRQAVAHLQRSSGEAVEVLRSVMNDDGTTAAVRVTAAKAIIEYSIKAVEVEDLAERVAELETLAKQQQGKRA